MRRYITMTSGIWRTIILLFFAATLFGCVVAHELGPRPLMLERPPSVVHIPGTYVYLIPGMDVDIFFYGGHWYRHHNNFWFRASIYDGSWFKVGAGNVPPRLHKLPRDYRRHLKPGSYHIPHGELKRHWKRWERERHWDQVGKKELKKKHEKKGRRYD
jgi:hypothetical protein